ncbi:Maf family protein [Ferruginivarius sediminum]|uniref:Nucleoside triphosphate pyrophosphatase n=1 Tax=Ferruginivarius sediminum TaxID=2661937 RepID=A0A369TD82_9PROT|nr:Maf family protein [Ferruginivarius sediminum]RDD63269.1 septum formation protein Maf [Ferruginivarius sediminum]
MAEPLQPKRRVAGAKPDAPSLVLASKSAARRQMLLDAGVPVVVDSAGIDEESVKAGLRAEGATPHEVAEVLAELKATRISPRHPGALVLGADQMLECEGKWFDKPADTAGAAAHLKALSGQSHRLIASAVIVKDGTRIWHQVDSAELTMRPLSDAFIAAYLDAVGDDALHSVGAYQLEGLGAQLFTRVRGDYFTVLGLPLLPLLEFLRTHGVIAR